MLKTDPSLDALLKAALKEDVGPRDLSSTLIPAGAVGRADAAFKEEGVLCGVEIAERLFRLVDADLRFLPAAKDGELVEKDRVIFYAEGPTRSILAAERTALNFVGRMSGVATLTRKFVEAVKGTSAAIYDTRKTTPLLRRFERQAVAAGGGHNHRFGLYDGVLIKDNHLRALAGRKFGDLLKEVRRRISDRVPVGIEVQTLEELREALMNWFDYVLLDNFAVEDVRRAVELRRELGANVPLEVSGGVRLENVRAYAECGVERISVGALTHAAPAVDVSLNLL